MRLPALTEPFNDASVPFYDARGFCVPVDLFLNAWTLDRIVSSSSELVGVYSGSR